MHMFCGKGNFNSLEKRTSTNFVSMRSIEKSQTKIRRPCILPFLNFIKIISFSKKNFEKVTESKPKEAKWDKIHPFKKKQWVNSRQKVAKASQK